MADSWDDDEWDVPDLDLKLNLDGGAGSSGNAFDDEVDEVVVEEVQAATPAESTLAAKAKNIGHV